MSPALLDDPQLIELAAIDHRGAFAELVRRHQSKTRNLLMRLTRGNRVLADDLAQETFLRAYRGLAGFQGRARFSTWLHRIAYYVYLNHRNRSKQLAGLPEELEATLPAPEDELSPARSDLRRDMRLLVASLPTRYREVIELHFWQHVPYRDIANELGLPLGTVKTQLHRAKALMRERLETWNAPPAAA